MRQDVNQQKRKRWLTPLAMCLAVILAMYPTNLDVVWAEEDNVEETPSEAPSGTDVFREAVDAYWSAETSYWEAEQNFWTKQEQYWEAAESEAAELESFRNAVRESVTVLNRVYEETSAGYANLSTAYNELTDEERADTDVSSAMTDIRLSFEGDGSEEQKGITNGYQGCLQGYTLWNFGDIEKQYWNARTGYDLAASALWGDEENGITGTMQTYEEAKAARKDLEAYRENVRESIRVLEDAHALVNEKYDNLTEAYNAIPEEARYPEAQECYNGVSGDQAEFERVFQEAQIGLWLYYEINTDYWGAVDVFWDSVDSFYGNEEKNKVGAYTAYMDARESKATGLEALYKNALEARAAVENAYNNLKAIYQSENTEYGALTQAEQSEAAECHVENVNYYSNDIEPAYNDLCGLEIPTPPQKEEPSPTPVPTTPPQDIPAATPKPTTAPGQTSAPQSAPKQEPLSDWNVVYKNVESSVASGEAQNVYAYAGAKFQVPGNILDKLAQSRTALFVNTGIGLSFSISGVDVPRGVSSFKMVLAATDGIPASAKESVLTDAVFSRTFAMEDKGVYPIKVDVHLNVGRENAGKDVYLYYYDEIAGGLKLAGSFKATEAGQVMFAINHGDEYIVAVANSVTTQHGRYIVAPGDNLSRIAVKNGISLRQLLKVNPGIKNPNKIYPGDVINLD